MLPFESLQVKCYYNLLSTEISIIITINFMYVTLVWNVALVYILKGDEYIGHLLSRTLLHIFGYVRHN
jgi:uncharacterized protein YebE (UPF0316 family)